MTMRRLFAIVLAAGLLLAGGCAGKPRIRIDGLGETRWHGLTGFDAELRVENRTRRDLTLQEGRVTLWCDDRPVCLLIATGQPTAPRRALTAVPTRWRMRPQALVGWVRFQRLLAGGETERLAASFEGSIRAGRFEKNISIEKAPLSEILATFGLTTSDLKDFLP